MEAKLAEFSTAIEATDVLEIDGTIMAGETFEGKKYDVDSFKIDNHKLRTSYVIPVSEVALRDVPVVVEALLLGSGLKLYGITRIVGYYSRTSNWNKSKRSELRDRIRGRAHGGYYVDPQHVPQNLEEALMAVP